RSEVIEVLKTVRDPELPINIYDMGLIYAVDVSPDDVVTIRMTLTTPMCPVADVLPAEVETKVKAISGVKDAKVELVWDPPWSPDRMSEAARLEAGFF
ncbi:MAG: iron-sulfur cluster assembly protein, partial [Planctomycetota bacterium]